MLLTFRISKSRSNRAAAPDSVPDSLEPALKSVAAGAMAKVVTRILATLLFSLSATSLWVTGNAAAADLAPDSIRLSRCLDEIDLIARQYDFADANNAEQQLKQLQYSCSHVPQLHHNLGVIAAAKLQWKEAIAYFKQSLALDKRAAMTHQSLASIYQFKANLAYKKALNLAEKIKLPVLAMQTSALTNLCRADYAQIQPQPDAIIQASLKLDAPAATPVVIEVTPPQDAVRYDVNSWWTARQEQDSDALPAHYLDADDIRSPLEERATYSWSELTVDIEFVDHVALVSISYPHSEWAQIREEEENPTNPNLLLVMKEYDSMWKIVREEEL